MGSETAPKGSFERYSLKFAEAGLDGGRWNGAVVALAGSDDDLKERLKKRICEFVDLASTAESF
ncbi:Uncharacterised protein [uncultured archaeon]|nr:Uncharacterised protein [uncultured archaeon]